MSSSISNVISNALKPGYFQVMLGKLKKRLLEPGLKRRKEEATAWCAERTHDTFQYIQKLDAELAKEAVSYNEQLQIHGQQVISKLPVKMGGGGNCVLLYFLARKLNPAVIVETGVSMGFSSHAFLSALQRNGNGHLYSSDFPYFRLANPEQYIGCVVEEQLKSRWTLLIEGDAKNLAEIGKQVGGVDLFHYDSDKSYAGRSLALQILEQQLSHATIVFDDIGDNFHFRDLVEKSGVPYLILTNPAGGYVGLTGKLLQAQK